MEQQQEQQQSVNAVIEVGDYVQRNNYNDDDEFQGYQYGIVTDIRSGGRYEVLDQDGDNDTWAISQLDMKKADAEEVKKKFILLPDFTGGYDGVVDFEKQVLRVGCQDLPFTKVHEIADLCRIVN